MERKTIFTNQFDEKDAEKVDELLDQGYAVKVEANCMGHTRAWMVECGAKAHFESRGCKPVKLTTRDVDGFEWKETYYTL